MATSTPRRRPAPHIAMIAICGAAIVILIIFQFTMWYRCVMRKNNDAETMARYKPLATLLPADEVANFVIDADHADLVQLGDDTRLYQAQYAASPKRLGLDVHSTWVVTDSDSADIEPEVATSAHWTLVADLRNGVRLYRTHSGE